MYLLVFVFGLVIGSFLNVVICRLKTKETIFFNRSYCPECKAVLRWYDLIPILSFLIQRGKCRYCEKKISWQYPLVEISTACLFLLIFNFQFSIFNLIYYLIIVSLLIVIFTYDLKHYLIPDRIVFPGMIITLLYQVLSNDFYRPVLAGLATSGFFLLLVLITKGKGMGLGDVKLVGLMGLILSWPNVLIALFLSFFSGAVIGLLLIVFSKKGLKSQIPFGPFLSGATVLTMFYSQFLIDWCYRVLPILAL